MQVLKKISRQRNLIRTQILVNKLLPFSPLSKVTGVCSDVGLDAVKLHRFFIFTGLMDGSRQIQTGALGTWFGIIWSVRSGIT